MSRDKVHFCELPEDYGGLEKLPPNAPFKSKIYRYLRKLIAPNTKSAICKRNFRNQSQINTERRRHAQNKYIFIIHPYSDLELFREIIFVLIGLWEIITSPLNASFGFIWRYGDENLVYEANLFTAPNLTVFVIEVVWIISCFFAAYKEPNTQVIELNQRKIVKRYLLTYFIFDLLFLSPPINNDDYEGWIYWINLMILARLGTLQTYSKRLLTDLGVPDSGVKFIILVALSIFIVHVFSCIFYVLPFQFNHDENELWLVKTQLHPKTNLIKVYLSCFSMVQTHFWGLGEAAMRVDNVMENLILIVAMIVGRLWSLFLLATMLRVFTISSLSESKYEEYLLQLKTFISQKQLPKEFADRLLEYYQYKYQHHYFNEKAIFTAMSHFLKQEILLYSARNVISKVSLFKYFPRSLVGSIIAKCKIMVFLNHDVVLNAGNSIENVYFISCGTLAVFNDNGVELAHLSDGDDVGMRGVVAVCDTYYKYTYIAIETTEVYVISIKDLRAILYNKSDILKYFAKKVEEKTRDMEEIEIIASAQGVDLLSALRHGKLLERPRVRTRYFDH